MNVNGYTYQAEYDTEYDEYGRPEVTKIFHYIVTPDGERKMVDFTPYERMTREDVEAFIALGFPGRRPIPGGGSANWSTGELPSLLT